MHRNNCAASLVAPYVCQCNKHVQLLLWLDAGVPSFSSAVLLFDFSAGPSTICSFLLFAATLTVSATLGDWKQRKKTDDTQSKRHVNQKGRQPHSMF